MQTSFSYHSYLRSVLVSFPTEGSAGRCFTAVGKGAAACSAVKLSFTHVAVTYDGKLQEFTLLRTCNYSTVKKISKVSCEAQRGSLGVFEEIQLN